MSVTLHELLAPSGLRATLFPPTSRYHGVDVATRTGADGQPVAYLRRRFCPQPEELATLREHVVSEGERLDNVAAQHLGDPLLFWRLCDANRALDPAELLAVAGRRLRVALPEGVPGATHG
jgi:hypothetical protein